MPDSPSPYVHGTEPREQERLGIMNGLLNDAAVRAIGLRGGERLLDLGCGTGILSRALARAIGPTGRVVGIERSREQVAEADRLARTAGEAGLVDFRLGDATIPPLTDPEWATFDAAHTRFLLEHLPRPLDAVRVMVRAVRPGGRIFLQDDDHDILRVHPEPEGFMALWRAYVRTYELNGTDPFVGRKLPALLHAAGARPVRTSWIDFGGCAGDGRLGDLMENLARILEGAEEVIVGGGLMDRDACRAAIDRLRPWAMRPDAALFYAVACVEGVRPEA